MTTAWNEPVDLVPNELSDVDKFNTQVLDNLRHLYKAKIGTFGRSSELSVPDSTWTSMMWDFATLETVNMWSVDTYPERITPPTPGVWLATVKIAWPPGTGFRAVRMQQQGVYNVGQESVSMIPLRTTYSTFAAQVVLDGMGQYVNFHVYQESGGAVVLDGGHRLDMVWLGAV